MARPTVRAAGGWAAVRYSFRKAREAGGVLRLYRRLRSRNACKTCALGMGGQRGGMVNEQGHFPEVCKKSVQAQAGDLQAPISEAFFRRHAVQALESWTPKQMEDAGRLAFPVILEEGARHFRRLSWEEALDRAASALRKADPARTFFYCSGRSSNEAAFLLQIVARCYGARNIHNCSCYCHQASGVALSEMVGSGTATVVLDDLDRADLALVAGANPASNHPRLITKLVDLRRRGGKVIVVNPLRELGLERFRIPSRPGSLLFGSRVSDLYLQPHAGTDMALFKALLKGILERGGEDRSFLDEHVEGWDEVEADVRSTSWETLLQACGVSRELVDTAVATLVQARRGLLCWAMGLTHHAHGVDTIHTLAHVALARGWLGRPGSGLLPIRGHSNVQGVGSVGFTPSLKEAFARNLEERFGIRALDSGLDTYASMEAAARGEIDVAVLWGGNLYGSNPDLSWAARALQRIGTTVYVSTKLNPGHVHGRGRTTLILPVRTRDEELQPTTQESMFNYVRLSDGGQPAPAGQLKSEVEVVAQLAVRLLDRRAFPFQDLTDHRSLRRAIARVVPGYGAMERMDDSGQEFQIEGRTFHEPRFATPSGKARVRAVPLPDLSIPPDAFRLMTLRSEGQFNTVVYEEDDLYRGVSGRDVVMMNETDASRLGIREGDRVRVRTEAGAVDVRAVFLDLPPGNLAMYYPEANVVVPRRVDPKSGTPAFKSVTARLEPAGLRGTTAAPEGAVQEA